MTSRSAGSAGPIRCCRRWDSSGKRLSDDVKSAFGATDTAPLIVADAFVTLESSGRRASNVIVYGVDERFWTFQGLPPIDGVMVSPALAAEVGAKDGDVLLTRLQKPSEIPIESLFGRKEDVGRTVRLTLAGVLARDRLGEFALRPQQADVRAVFAPLRRLQRDLAVHGQVNTILVSGGEGTDAKLRSALQLEDLGVRVRPVLGGRAVAIESANGIIAEALETAARAALDKLGLQPIPVFTYLANSIRKGDRQIPYSLVTATDLGQVPEVDGAAGARRLCRRLVAPGVLGRSERGRDCAEWMGGARARGNTGRSCRRRLLPVGRDSRSRHAQRAVHGGPSRPNRRLRGRPKSCA